jgi:hypothetical protein
LPIAGILARLRRHGCRFAIVDACQQIGHVPSDGLCAADLVIAGVHKWVGAGLPMGVALAPADVARKCQSLCRDDPLIAFTTSDGRAERIQETVNVWPLLSSHAAFDELLNLQPPLTLTLAARQANADRLMAQLPGRHWTAVAVSPTLQSGIVLLRPRRSAHNLSACESRRRLEGQGIDVTALPGNLLRVSLPEKAFSVSQLRRLRVAMGGHA